MNAFTDWINKQYFFETPSGTCVVIDPSIDLPELDDMPRCWEDDFELVIWPDNPAGPQILALAKENELLKDGARLVLGGFDSGVFVRDTSGDDKPGWALKMVNPVRGLALLAEIATPLVEQEEL